MRGVQQVITFSRIQEYVILALKHFFWSLFCWLRVHSDLITMLLKITLVVYLILIFK